MESVVELITRLSQPSLRVFPEEMASCQKLAEVSKRFSFLQAQAFVHDHVDAPLLEVTMQDGTPLATHTIHTVQGPENIVVRRRGKKGREWLVQRIFLVNSSGKKMMLYGDPKEMSCKTAAAHHQALVGLWLGSRVLGHKGICVAHGVWDRAVQSA